MIQKRTILYLIFYICSTYTIFLIGENKPYYIISHIYDAKNNDTNLQNQQFFNELSEHAPFHDFPTSEFNHEQIILAQFLSKLNPVQRQ